MVTADRGLVLSGLVMVPMWLVAVVTGCVLIATGELVAVVVAALLAVAAADVYRWLMRPRWLATDASKWAYDQGEHFRAACWNAAASLWVMFVMLVWCLVAFWIGSNLAIESKTAAAWWTYVLALGPCVYWARQDWKDRDEVTALWVVLGASIVLALAALMSIE